jgi:hypothetical protein
MDPCILEHGEDRHLVGLPDGTTRWLPRVTSIIARWYPFLQPPEVLAIAAARGTAVHRGTHIIDADPQGIDWATVDAPLVPYLQAYQKFLSECRATPIEREFPVCNLLHGYIGTPDGVYAMRFEKGGEGESLIDIKSGMPMPTHALQTAAYEEPARKRFGRRKPFARHALYLKPDGTYRLVQHTDPRDLAAFLGLLQAYYWEQGQ